MLGRVTFQMKSGFFGVFEREAVDPIRLLEGRSEAQPLILAATKSNIGHLEGAV